MNTSSVASAYRRPVRGLDGAGDGGKLCPAKSTCENGFFSAFLGSVDDTAPFPVELSGSDITVEAMGSGGAVLKTKGMCVGDR